MPTKDWAFYTCEPVYRVLKPKLNTIRGNISWQSNSNHWSQERKSVRVNNNRWQVASPSPKIMWQRLTLRRTGRRLATRSGPRRSSARRRISGSWFRSDPGDGCRRSGAPGGHKNRPVQIQNLVFIVMPSTTISSNFKKKGCSLWLP